MDEIWNARRIKLAEQVVAAAQALLDHTHAAGFAIPMGDGSFVAAGTPDYLTRATDTSNMQPYQGSN